METTLAIKAYLAFVTPLLASVLGVYSHLSWYILIPTLAFISFVSLQLMFGFLYKIALGKKANARKKYENQSFRNLKVLVLSNPEEAALFIQTRAAKLDLTNSLVQPQQLAFNLKESL